MKNNKFWFFTFFVPNDFNFLMIWSKNQGYFISRIQSVDNYQHLTFSLESSKNSLFILNWIDIKKDIKLLQLHLTLSMIVNSHYHSLFLFFSLYHSISLSPSLWGCVFLRISNPHTHPPPFITHTHALSLFVSLLRK